MTQSKDVPASQGREENILDRLTDRSPKNNMAYLVGVKNDEQELEGTYNTLMCVRDALEKLAAYEDSERAPEDFKQLVGSKATEQENIELRKEIVKVSFYHHKLGEVIARNLVAWDTSKDKLQGLLPEVYLTNKQAYHKLFGEEYEFKRACDLFHIGDDWS